MRRSTAAFVAAVLAASVLPPGTVRSGRAAEDEVAGALVSLGKAVDEGRLAGALAQAHAVKAEILARWAKQVKEALPAAPTGFVTDPPDGSILGGRDEGPLVARSYRRGEAAEVRLLVDLAPYPWDKPHEANLPWILWSRDRAAEGRGASEVRFAGRQAFLEVEEVTPPRLTLGLVLPHGATFGVIAAGGVTKEEVLRLFGEALDLAALERVLWRGRTPSDLPSASPYPASRAAELVAAGRLGEAYDEIRWLTRALEADLGRALAALLEPVPAGFTAEPAEASDQSASRAYAGTGGLAVGVRLWWCAEPSIYGHLERFLDPRRLEPDEEVAEVAGSRLLLVTYRGPYEGPEGRTTAIAFLLGGSFRLEVQGSGAPRERWLAPFFSALDPKAIEAAVAKLR